MRVLDDGGQYCGDCQPNLRRSAEAIGQAPPDLKRPEARKVAGVATSAIGCPDCGRSLDAAVEVCPCQVVRLRSEVAFGGFFVRAAAFCADWLLLGTVGLIVAFATNSFLNAAIAMLAAGLVSSAGFWIADGATPGKMLFGLKVRMIDGRPVEPVAAVIRYFAYLASGLLLGIGFIVMLFSEERRGLHDMIANTIVIYEGDLRSPEPAREGAD